MSTIIKGDFSRQRQAKKENDPGKEPAPHYQLKIFLAFSDPLIWRRLVVSGDTTLQRLHHIIQRCMGWQDIHDHRFLVGKVFYGPSPNGDIWEQTGERDESEYCLAMLEEDMKWCFTYIYDFGDGWEHQIEIEEIIPAGKGGPVPVVLAGERACPPEDVGGIPGYEEFLSVINNPRHRKHRQMAEWLGADRFDSEGFSPEAVNKVLKRIK